MIIRHAPLRVRVRAAPCTFRPLRLSSGRHLGTGTGTSSRPLVVLGLESSADDSSCALVTSDRRVLSLVTISQHVQNAKYGGIHPLAAQAAHTANIPRAIERCLAQAGMGMGDVDAVAYTRGPGMRGCLAIGEMAAKGLAAGTGKRLVGVHHMQAHALTPLLTEPHPPAFPFLILLVSGGHTQLVLAQAEDRFEILLDTLDSKIGDVFEKAARLLQLPAHPQKSPGAILESYASLPPLSPFDARPHKALPIPLSTNTAAATRAFSFAGILSSLQRLALAPPSDPSSSYGEVDSPSSEAGVSPDPQNGSDTAARPEPEPEPEPKIGEAQQREYSRIFQTAAVGHLTLKLEQAIRHLPGPLRDSLGGLVVSGGVASNLYMRGKLGEMLARVEPRREVGLYFPPVELCTDNAAMIAWTAILRLQAGLNTDPYDLPLRPRWSLEDLYDDLPVAAEVDVDV